MRSCHFCGSPLRGKKSREHVVPEWLAKHLGVTENEARGTHYAEDATVRSVRSMPTDQLVLGGVCKPCNEGWMSLLEQRAKPVLLRLMAPGANPESLAVSESATLARWSLKTALALNLAVEFERLADREHLLALGNDSLGMPSSFYVFCALHDPTSAYSWLQTRGLAFFAGAHEQPAPHLRSALGSRGFRIGLQFGRLCLAVVYWPDRAWTLAVWPELHTPVWPPDSSLVPVEHQYDGESNPLAVDSRLFLYRMLDTIALIEPRPGPLRRLAVLKNRDTHVSGREPAGMSQFLPVPSVITPEVDQKIRAWLRSNNRGTAG